MFPMPPITKVKNGRLGCISGACRLHPSRAGNGPVGNERTGDLCRGSGARWRNPNNWYGSTGGGSFGLLLSGYGYNQEINFADVLGIPVHLPVWEISARYQFRPNWAFRYSVLGFEANSNGMGNNWWTYGYGLNAKWNHYYHRLGLIYDAIRNCKAKVSVFADWVHTDDTISANCSACGVIGTAKMGQKRRFDDCRTGTSAVRKNIRQRRHILLGLQGRLHISG